MRTTTLMENIGRYPRMKPAQVWHRPTVFSFMPRIRNPNFVLFSTDCLLVCLFAFVDLSFQYIKDNVHSQCDKKGITSDSSTVKIHEHAEPCAGRHGSDSQDEMKTNNHQGQESADIADQETSLEQ